MRNKFVRGWPAKPGKEPPPPAVLAVPLEEALTRSYDTDAHLVCFVARDRERYHRVRKPHVAQYDAPLDFHVLMADVDNPRHRRWTCDAEVHAQHTELLGIDVLAHAGWYFTNGGYRIVQPVAAPQGPDEHERHLARWYRELAEVGIEADPHCLDWARLFRAPNVRRDGVDVRPLVYLDRMEPIELVPLPGLPPEPAGTARKRRRAVVVIPEEWRPFSPKIWHDRIPVLAAAIRAEPSDWHDLFLALTGALVDRHVPAAHVPSLVAAISVATRADTRTDDRERGAMSTIERAAAGERYTGYSELKRRSPGVARALDRVLATGREAQIIAELTRGPVPETPDVGKATADLTWRMWNAEGGLCVVSAECGLGKTHAALAAVAGRTNVAPTPFGLAPRGSKAAIAVNTHALAKQCVDELGAMGVPALRLQSPLQVVDARGDPVCRYHEEGRALVAGGQSMQRLLCLGGGANRCELYDGCTARLGVDGDPNARVAVGPHGLMSRLIEHAGTTGLVVVDEPPSPLETEALRATELAEALDAANVFTTRYAGAMLPALLALRAAVASDVTDEGEPLEALVRRHAAAVDEEQCEVARRNTGVTGSDPVAFARAAYDPDAKSTRFPPIRQRVVKELRGGHARAAEVGAASRVFGLLCAGLSGERPMVARVMAAKDGRRVVLARGNEFLMQAVAREGPVFVLDAGAAMHMPTYRRLSAGEVEHIHIPADDGAPIERTMVFCASACRSKWCPGGIARVAPSLVRAVRTTLAWAEEHEGADGRPVRLALITMKPVRALLEVAMSDRAEAAARAWEVDPTAAEAAVAKLRPLLVPWRGRVVLGHYGALRGLNAMADVDALATLGDPRPNLDAVRLQGALCGPEFDWQARVRDDAKAELEQAHGRLRVVHRTMRGRALHVGTIVPGGFGWSNRDVELRPIGTGRMARADVAHLDTVRGLVQRAGGITKAARLVGVHRNTVGNYVAGRRPIPPAVLAALGASVQGRDEPC